MDGKHDRIANTARAEAVRRAGGLNALARQLTAAGEPITGQAVGRWQGVPIDRVLAVNLITDVPLWELAPDFYARPFSGCGHCGARAATRQKSKR